MKEQVIEVGSVNYTARSQAPCDVCITIRNSELCKKLNKIKDCDNPLVIFKLVNKNLTPRPHADIIKAWADGHKIQVFSEYKGKWLNTDIPRFSEYDKFRIAPENN